MSREVRIYNEGYMNGHHDTVESQFTHIYPQDMDTFQSDVVADVLAELDQPPQINETYEAALHEIYTKAFIVQRKLTNTHSNFMHRIYTHCLSYT